MLILTAIVALLLPLATWFASRPQQGYQLEATISAVSSDRTFVATYMGLDDGASPGDAVTVYRGQDYVSEGKILSTTADTATVPKTGWGSWRVVTIGDRVVAYVTLTQMEASGSLGENETPSSANAPGR